MSVVSPVSLPAVFPVATYTPSATAPPPAALATPVGQTVAKIENAIDRNGSSVSRALTDLSRHRTGMSAEHLMRLQYMLSEHLFTLNVVSGLGSGFKQSLNALTQNG
jgi:hypothetical protein